MKITFNEDFRTFKKNTVISTDVLERGNLLLVGDNGIGKTTLLDILFVNFLKGSSSSYPYFNSYVGKGDIEWALSHGAIQVECAYTFDMMNLSESDLRRSETIDRLGEKEIEDFFSYSERIAYHLDLTHLSKGESNVSQIIHYVLLRKKMWEEGGVFILDEPDSSLSPVQIEMMKTWLPKERLIMTLHNEKWIEESKSVLYLFDVDGSTHVEEVSGKEALERMKAEGIRKANEIC